MIKIKAYYVRMLFFTSMAITVVNISVISMSQAKDVDGQDAVVLSNKKSSLYPMSMMSDDPLAIKIKAWQKKQALKLKTKKQALKFKTKKQNAAGVVSTDDALALPDKKIINKHHIIKFEVPEDEAESVNPSKSFVFGDRTGRDNPVTVDSKKQNQKVQSINALRHSMAVKQGR